MYSKPSFFSILSCLFNKFLQEVHASLNDSIQDWNLFPFIYMLVFPFCTCCTCVSLYVGHYFQSLKLLLTLKTCRTIFNLAFVKNLFPSVLASKRNFIEVQTCMWAMSIKLLRFDHIFKFVLLYWSWLWTSKSQLCYDCKFFFLLSHYNTL